MRIPIAVQLGLLVLLTALLGIIVLAVATWITTYDFVVDVKSHGLELVATIKASQIASSLELLEVTCKAISTRLLIQSALRRYYAGNSSESNWVNSITDVQSALGSRGYLSTYQVILYSKNGQDDRERLLSVTSDTIPDITLPYTYSNGTAVMLGDEGLGYPPMLYPNLTYTKPAENTSSVAVTAFTDYTLGLKSALLLGPVKINSSFSLVSLTLPIVNNTSDTDLLGFMTVVASAQNIQSVVSSRDGLGPTGQVLLLGPSRPENRFPTETQSATATSTPNTPAIADEQVHYVFEPTPLPSQESRHGDASTDTSFELSKYPMALKLMLETEENENKSISKLSTKNEEGYTVAVGAVRPKTSLVEWILLVEETHDEAFTPVARLRKIILACVFGSAGFIILVVPLMAHLAVAPIRRMREAARKSIEPESPPTPSPDHLERIEQEGEGHGDTVQTIEEHMDEKGAPSTWAKRLRRPLERFNSSHSFGERRNTRSFRIPGRVKERRHCVTDELTELTSTFNEMSDELTIQYTRLEERVAERTRELEKAKLSAEKANESKTLFIANISHELKTPLNGILGMCAVCMGEDDLHRIKKSLQVVYKSGDLLLHLLNDLLTFSRNQIEQAIQLEEKEFRLSDIRSQLSIIFQNQVHEKQINFSVNFVAGGDTQTRGTMCQEKAVEHAHPVLGPPQTGRLKDMVLWGDQHRVLQVLINLVSNSLKFTPENGKVEVRIRCLDEVPNPESATTLVQDSTRGSQLRSRTSSRASTSPRDAATLLDTRIEGPPPAPSNLRTLVFQFEVEDNGPGIPSHMQRRVFDPFVQGDLGLNRKYGGTGLGLSICAQLSRLMGGVILLDSEEGKGALFTLKIPLRFVKESADSTRSSSMTGSRSPSVMSLSLEEFSNIAQTPSNHSSVNKESRGDVQPRLVGLSQPFFAPTVPSPPPSSQGKHPGSSQGSSETDHSTKKTRVLMAEDNKINQEVALRMLALEEVYDVTVVKDGQEAYDTVKANMEEGRVFDLIFMDIQMPILDGLESTRLIRQMGYSAPIVALSAFAEDSNIKDCMDSGMDMFISKPIRRPVLKQVLNKFATIPEESESGSTHPPREKVPAITEAEVVRNLEAIQTDTTDP
ncbi:Histidine kinase [Aspergillus hancockii]|nr:Histidine kinase [Aspergillus hancockii]